MNKEIKNPIMAGFHPDPSAICIEDTYYIATSTFEWYPGVEIIASHNLRDWKVVSRPLSTLSKLDMRGEVASDGIWAPNLSYCDGIFYLVYTDMKNGMTKIKDLDNYLITAPSIEGPWSEPIYLNSVGFDPALFHDDDGRKYLINMVCDYRPGKNRFGGIQMQEYDEKNQILVGERKLIYQPNGLREGSNLYKINGYYYLMVAEGGTGIEHSSVLSRSENIWGPYVDDPKYYLLTSRLNPFHSIQKAGHSSLVRNSKGEYYLFHLGARPLFSTGTCPLGRELFLQNIVFDKDGWFSLSSGSYLPSVAATGPVEMEDLKEEKEEVYTFEKGLPNNFYSLREPLTDKIIKYNSDGSVTLFGARSLFSLYSQALIATKVRHFVYEVSTKLSFKPFDFQQAAGLIVRYDEENFMYVAKGYDELVGDGIKVCYGDNGNYTESEFVECDSPEIWLKIKVRYNWMQSYYSLDGENYLSIGRKADSSKLSDEYCHYGRFTGTMAGLCAQDLVYKKIPATFKYFKYEVIENAEI